MRTDHMTVADAKPTTRPLNPRSRGRFLASMGLLLMMGPLVGFVIEAFEMIQNYGILASGGHTSIDLGRQVGFLMKVTMWGIGASIVGSIFVGVAVTALGNRELWVYRNGLVLAVIMCLTLGVLGVVFGGGVIAILLVRRSDFHQLDDRMPKNSWRANWS